MQARSIFLVAAASVLFPASARADDIARAQALFDEGKTLFDSESYAAACPKFDESRRLAPGLGVTLYLAACEEAIGKRATALSLYHEAEVTARARGDARVEVARQSAADIENKTARMRIHLPKGVTGTVTDNGRVVSSSDSRGYPVDPGTHRIAVTSNGKKEWADSIHVPETAEDAPPPLIDVMVPAQESSAPIAAQSSPAPFAEPADARSNGTTQRAIGIGVGAAGIVSLGLGTYFGVHAISVRNQSNDPGGGCNASDQCDAHGQSLRSSALDSATVSTVLFAVGGAAIAAGVVLYVTAPSSHADVAVGLGPGGATFAGRF